MGMMCLIYYGVGVSCVSRSWYVWCIVELCVFCVCLSSPCSRHPGFGVYSEIGITELLCIVFCGVVMYAKIRKMGLIS